MRGFRIPSFLGFGRDVWVSEGDLRSVFSWPWVGRGDGVILRFSTSVRWFNPGSHLGTSRSHLQNKTKGES